MIDIPHLHGLANFKVAAVRLFESHDEAEQRGFPRTVRSDDPHDAVGRQVEVEIVEKQLVAEGLAHMASLDDVVAQTRSVGDENLQFFLLLLHILIEQFVVGTQTGFRLGVAGLRSHAHPLQLAL